MNTVIIERLGKLADEGGAITSSSHISIWYSKVLAFIGASLGTEEATRFSRLGNSSPWESHAMRVGHILGLLAKEQAKEIKTIANRDSSATSENVVADIDSKKIFVVHGHDNEAKESTARFLEKIGLQPIILHEQASSGYTIIEKFEVYSGDVAFAVVLLTPDDIGANDNDQSNLKKRARQNVIMELGYFMGRLGRGRVCALHKGGVELPSDYQGILYIEMDQSGAWKSKLAQELVRVKLPIELTGLLGS